MELGHHLRKDGEALWAPHRGKYPICPEGYENDTDPYRCVPITAECEYRTREMVQVASCGCRKERVQCSLLGRNVTMNICRKCGIMGKERMCNAWS